MSAAMDSDTDTIYIKLLDEGTEVIRPTQGVSLGNSEYKVLATTDYDPDDEHWEFPPGSIVKCVSEVREDETVLVAKQLAE